MSNEILNRLRDRHAFKPKPPDHELARAHIRVGDIGLANPIDDRVIKAMTRSGEAFTIVIGPSGSGKSSLFAAAVQTIVTDLELTPTPVPLKVPVAIHSDPITVDLLVRGITQSLATTLGPSLAATELAKLEQNLSSTIAVTQQGPRTTSTLSGGLVIKGELARDFGHDLITVTTRAEWKHGGPIAQLEAIYALAAGIDHQLVVIIDDTDIWTAGDDAMAARASRFFSSLRSIKDTPELRMLVSVQTHWTDITAGGSAATIAAHREYHELAERVETRLIVPQPRSQAEGETLITAVIERRIEIALEEMPAPSEGWAQTLFTAEALQLLGARCHSRSIRKAINDIRDVFDHLADMPEAIGVEHLVEVIDE
jgi:hypothetical protein